MISVFGNGNFYVICGIVVVALLVCAGIVIFTKRKQKKGQQNKSK